MRCGLQESHTVKAGGAQQSLACVALAADRRWGPTQPRAPAMRCSCMFLCALCRP